MSRCFKSGFVTIIGRPNVGKSTLMNQLIGQKIAITSSKAQTTRNRIQTVYTSEEGQIVFLDTPGINKAKNKLGDYMLMAAERTLLSLIHIWHTKLVICRSRQSYKKTFQQQWRRLSFPVHLRNVAGDHFIEKRRKSLLRGR